MTDAAEEPSGAPKRRPWAVVAPFILFMVLAGVFLVALKVADPKKIPSELIGRQLPQFDLPALASLKRNGEPIPGLASADLAKGKVTLINFWASWCVACRAEHPIINRLVKEDGLRVVGINYKDAPDAALKWLARFGNPYLAVGVDRSGRTGIDFGVYGIPESFIIDGTGKIVYKQIGPISQEIAQTIILPKMAEAKQNSR